MLAHLAPYSLKDKGGGRYTSNSPLRPGSNSHAFSMMISGPEHGGFVDFVSGERGSLYQLAEKLGIRTPTTKPTTRTLVATYDYVDADGTLLYQSCRYEPGRDGRKKDFTQRVPDGHGDWSWSMDGVTRVLYRLPDVAAAVAAEETIYIVEGEKDADQLRLYGLTATTNVAGAGKWRTEYSAVLDGAHVVILPDNDAPGAAHAVTVATSLEGIAASIKVVELPGLPPKGDVSDWLNAGHTLEELDALIVDAPEYTPAPLTLATPVTSTLGPTAALAKSLMDAGYHCVLNTETDEITINGEMLSDITRALLRSNVRDQHLGPIGILDDALTLQAKQHERAPIRDGLAELTWDGAAHIARLSACLQTKNDEVVVYADGRRRRAADVYLLRWLLGAVGRVFNAEQNAMIVLDGPQGIGKSSFVKWLGGVLTGVYCEESISPQDKDCLLRLTRTLVWEAGELDATTRKHDVAALKHFLTRSSVTARRAYGRHDVTKPVLTSFIGTVNTNGNGFLPDPTGNRRYLVLTLTGIDWSYQRLDPRQVWAEAVARYQRGERGNLSGDEATYRDRTNAEQHQLTGLMDDWLNMYFVLTGNDSDMMTSGEIAVYLSDKNITVGNNSQAAAMVIADALTRAGVKKADRRAAKAYYGTFQRAWAGIATRNSDPADPARSTLSPMAGSSRQQASNINSDPPDPPSKATLRNQSAEPDMGVDSACLSESSELAGSGGSAGSRHIDAIQPSGRLDRGGSGSDELPAGYRLEKCDHKGNRTAYGIHWHGIGPNGEVTEPEQHRDSAISAAWKRSKAS